MTGEVFTQGGTRCEGRYVAKRVTMVGRGVNRVEKICSAIFSHVIRIAPLIKSKVPGTLIEAHCGLDLHTHSEHM